MKSFLSNFDEINYDRVQNVQKTPKLLFIQNNIDQEISQLLDTNKDAKTTIKDLQTELGTVGDIDIQNYKEKAEKYLNNITSRTVRLLVMKEVLKEVENKIKSDLKPVKKIFESTLNIYKQCLRNVLAAIKMYNNSNETNKKDAELSKLENVIKAPKEDLVEKKIEVIGDGAVKMAIELGMEVELGMTETTEL